jgi:hypothetical protein
MSGDGQLFKESGPVAVFLCDRTGVAARPWAEAKI